MVFEMYKWLDNTHNRTDELRQRDEVVEELGSTRTLIAAAHSELTEQ
jgi:hypothetical protein